MATITPPSLTEVKYIINTTGLDANGNPLYQLAVPAYVDTDIWCPKITTISLWSDTNSDGNKDANEFTQIPSSGSVASYLFYKDTDANNKFYINIQKPLTNNPDAGVYYLKAT